MDIVKIKNNNDYDNEYEDRLLSTHNDAYNSKIF